MAKRSYYEEILELPDTWNASSGESISITGHLCLKDLEGVAYCVGSGGSLVLAKLWEYLHEDYALGFAKTVTPYEYITAKKNPDLVVLFSASGKNYDILQVFKTAISRGSKVMVFTVAPESALLRLVKSNPLQAHAIYLTNNISKDGFLAVNSTIAMLSLMKHFLNTLMGAGYPSFSPVELAAKHHSEEHFEEVFSSNVATLQIIASDYAMPAGLDFEARLAESGVAAGFLTDPRNFGHGRFIWLDKHPENTKVVLINTLKSRQFMKRVEKSLPEHTQYFRIDAPYDGLFGTAYCITRTILLFGDLALKCGVDPGKPDVPEWGRKIHGLRLAVKDTTETSKDSGDSRNYPALTTQFSGIVMDLDGTLNDTKDRFGNIKKEIEEEINRLLKLGLKIGISTGRGSSALDLLRKCISNEFWNEITIGLYNGTLLMTLSENLKQPAEEIWPVMKMVTSVLGPICRESQISISSRPTQVTLFDLSSAQQQCIEKELNTHLGQKMQFIKVIISGHSMDIIPSWGTKLAVVEVLASDVSKNILCIGDQGQIGGNDEELLGWKPSISVGKQRPASNECLWLGHQKEWQESNGTLAILSAIEAKDGFFVIDSAKIRNKKL